MSLRRQTILYLTVGCSQAAIDSVLYIALSSIGLNPAIANIAGRFSGMLFGYWANGRYTFSSNPKILSHSARTVRFTAQWLGITAISTAAMLLITQHSSLEWSWLWKPIVELMLAALSFCIQRYWVFR